MAVGSKYSLSVMYQEAFSGLICTGSFLETTLAFRVCRKVFPAPFFSSHRRRALFLPTGCLKPLVMAHRQIERAQVTALYLRNRCIQQTAAND